MSLSSLYLDAFQAVARVRSFSGAAKQLAITQSALSQRVINLEEELGATLFIRESSGVRLTDLGARLLRYCKSKELLEVEFLAGLAANSPREVSGVLRVAGFSTVTRSVLVPILGEIVRENPRIQLEVMTAELRELPGLLSTGRADFGFVTQAIEKQGIENHLLGTEENVLIRPSLKKFRDDVFLDHDPEDTTTFDFWRLQGKRNFQFRRDYLDEIDTIIAGVKAGLGHAIVPLHIARETKGIEIVSGLKSLKVPIYLSYHSQAFYTDMQKLVIARFKSEFAKHLFT